jgi:hypothetical protein
MPQRECCDWSRSKAMFCMRPRQGLGGRICSARRPTVFLMPLAMRLRLPCSVTRATCVEIAMTMLHDCSLFAGRHVAPSPGTPSEIRRHGRYEAASTVNTMAIWSFCWIRRSELLVSFVLCNPRNLLASTSLLFVARMVVFSVGSYL